MTAGRSVRLPPLPMIRGCFFGSDQLGPTSFGLVFPLSDSDSHRPFEVQCLPAEAGYAGSLVRRTASEAKAASIDSMVAFGGMPWKSHAL